MALGKINIGSGKPIPKTDVRNNPTSTWTETVKGTANLNAIDYGENTIVIGGNNGTIIRSTDYGETWETISSGLTFTIKTVCFGAGHFVVGGTNYSIAYSRNQGATWTLVSGLGNTAIFNSIFYAQNKFVAVGVSGIYYSTDGEHWGVGRNYNNTADITSSFTKVIFDDGTWFASGSGAVYRSYNGVIWDEIIVDGDYAVKDVAYSPEHDKFFACGTFGSIYSSTDGTDWTREYLKNESTAAGSCIVSGNGVIVTVGGWGNVFTSNGNGTWTNTMIGDKTFNEVFFTGTYFIGIGNNGKIIYSKDGYNWGEKNIGGGATTATLNDGHYINGKLIVVGNAGLIATPPLERANAFYKGVDDKWHSYLPVVIDGDVDADDGNTIYMLATSDGQHAVMARTLDSVNREPLTATTNDIRLGTTAVTEEGEQVGEKIIPSYHTTAGTRYIPANTEFKIKIDDGDYYNYTAFQAMIMPYNTTLEDSVMVDKAVIEDKVYNAGQTTVVANVIKDKTNKVISLGITNGETPSIIRFFTYKEIY